MVLGRQVIYPVHFSSVHTLERPHCFLFDNGSLRAASTLSLRRAAELLSTAIAAPVTPVSLLHSSVVSPDQLDGKPAELLEPALNAWLQQNPRGRAIALPLFFGPSGALTDYVPERLSWLRAKYPEARLGMGSWLVHPEEPDTRIAEALAAAARKTIAVHKLDRPKVILVDHGSPQAAVALVRDHLGAQVKAMIGDEVSAFAVASMERRPGPEYHFNDPLLANLLGSPPYDAGDVVILLQFLSPGRHAGPSGDIAEICEEAARGCPDLRSYLTDPIANDPRVIAVLAERYRQVKI